MSRTELMLAAALLTVVPISAHAGDQMIDCANAISTADLNDCASKELDAADAELNAVYKEAIGSIPSMATDNSRFNAKSWEEALRKSQRAWVAFRDAECDGHVPMFMGGGTATTGEVIGCQTEMTRARQVTQGAV